MESFIQGLGQALAVMADSNMDSENAKALAIVTHIANSVPLSINWAKEWSVLSYKYFEDSLNIGIDQKYTAYAAADFSLYQEKLQQGQQEIGEQSNMLQNEKGALTSLGSAMEQVYSLAETPQQVLKSINKQILMLGS